METKQEVLAKYLDCDIDEIEESSHDDCLYELGDEEYLVLDDDESDQRTADNIKESAWAFRPEFLVCHIDGLDLSICETLKPLQEQCENANPLILAMIGDNLEDFVEDAVRSDGRGHFLSSYDGDEVEQGEYFIYRCN